MQLQVVHHSSAPVEYLCNSEDCGLISGLNAEGPRPGVVLPIVSKGEIPRRGDCLPSPQCGGKAGKARSESGMLPPRVVRDSTMEDSNHSQRRKQRFFPGSSIPERSRISYGREDSDSNWMRDRTLILTFPLRAGYYYPKKGMK